MRRGFSFFADMGLGFVHDALASGEKAKRFMNGTEADYTDDMGEMDDTGVAPVPDFLPPPDELIEREDRVVGVSERKGNRRPVAPSAEA